MSDQETNQSWHGDFDLDDCEEELVAVDLPPEMNVQREPNAGIRLTHKPTGLSVQSYGSPYQQENRKRAQRALKKRVEQRAGLL